MLAPKVSDPSVFRIWFGVCAACIVKELCKGGRVWLWRNCNDSKSVANSEHRVFLVGLLLSLFWSLEKWVQSGLVCIVSQICVFWHPNFKAITVTSITHILVDQKPWEILTNSRRVWCPGLLGRLREGCPQSTIPRRKNTHSFIFTVIVMVWSELTSKGSRGGLGYLCKPLQRWSVWEVIRSRRQVMKVLTSPVS